MNQREIAEANLILLDLECEVCWACRGVGKNEDAEACWECEGSGVTALEVTEQ